MKTNAYVAGVGMTRFGKYLDTTLKNLAVQSIEMALQDAGLRAADLEAAYMGNAAAGLIVGQEMIRGQVALRSMGVGHIPVVNVENACASSSTAFNQACAMVTAGAYDIVLVCGYEKLYHQDKMRSLTAFASAVDVEDSAGVEGLLSELREKTGISASPDTTGMRSAFMDIYSVGAQYYMKKYGVTREHFAMVSAKNSFHGSLNPNAQYQEVLTVDQVLNAREVVFPLTLPMCSPLGDGSAAVVLVSERKARQMGLKKPVKVLSTVLASGWDRGIEDRGLSAECADKAYEFAGVGPQDLSNVELHDASAPSELQYYEALGLCEPGDSGKMIESGATRLGGRIPVNTSGGLLRKGHPVGATGAAQIVELTKQLQGRADNRQVEGSRIALAHNAGGNLGLDAAACVVSILGRKELS